MLSLDATFDTKTSALRVKNIQNDIKPSNRSFVCPIDSFIATYKEVHIKHTV